jgi:muconate cycloisomerase
VKITQIETIPVQVPIHPQRAILSGRGAHTTSPFLLVRVYTDEGLIGLGEVSCTAIWSGEDQFTAARLIEGADPLPIEAGKARPHEKPGLGVELDDAEVERYRVR